MRKCKQWSVGTGRLVLGGVLLLGMTTTALAAMSERKQALQCRAGIPNSVRRFLVDRGLESLGRCVHGAEAAPDTCNTIVTGPAGAPTTPYGLGENRAQKAIDILCAPGNPVLENYVGGTPSDLVIPTVKSLLERGAPAGPPAAVQTAAKSGSRRGANDRCVRVATHARNMVVRSAFDRAVACQTRLDRKSQPLGPLSDACLRGAGGAARAARKALRQGCRSSTAGVCGPLPGCVVDTAVVTGENLARVSYSLDVQQQVVENVCGDGRKGGDEQCDDGNTVSNDGCSSTCTQEGCFIDDNVVGGEACDDGNTTDDDCCNNMCMPPVCGDGQRALGCDEQCDDAVDPGCIGCKFPAVTCDGRGIVLRVRVDYDKVLAPQLAGVRLEIGYPSQVSIPVMEGGFVDSSRLVDLTGKGVFLVGQVATSGTLGIVIGLAGGTFDSGDVFTALLDCSTGTSTSFADYQCRVLSASDQVGNDVMHATDIPCSVAQVSLP